MATKNRISLVSETSYLSVNEHRKTAEHAKLIVKQAEECRKRKLDLLKWLFELEKQTILDKELEAKNNADEFQNWWIK